MTNTSSVAGDNSLFDMAFLVANAVDSKASPIAAHHPR